MTQKVISIIPARGGSKGIKSKNIRILNGMPLIAYSIQQSLNSKLIDATYVSTEDPEIKRISLNFGANVIDRPPELATDTCSTPSVLLHAVKKLDYDFDLLVLLQPTSPLRYSEQIDESIKYFLDNNGDSLLSVCQNASFFWNNEGKSINYDFKNRPRRQDKDWELIENGSIYITRKETLLKENNQLGGKILTYQMPQWMSIEIDESTDLEIVEYLIKKRYYVERTDLKESIKKLKMIIFDADGVFTDGSVYINSEGKEFLRFSRIDGRGIFLIKNLGLKTVLLSGEDSIILNKRMEKLRIDEIYTGINNKLIVYNKLKQKYSIEDENICFLADDTQDLDVLKLVGFSCCPENAQESVKRYSKYVSSFKGGKGFIRDVCNLIIKYF